MSMNAKNCLSLIFLALATSGSAWAGPPPLTGPALGSNGIPALNCDRTNCSFADQSSKDSSNTQPAAPSPNPTVVGPPAGQRYLWLGAGYPNCQSIKSIVPIPTLPNPYVYISAATIPVPLGSTHATLLATAEGNISGGPAGSLAIAGVLQIKRSSTATWTNSVISYIYSHEGMSIPTSLYGTGSLQGLEDLASLPPAGSVPDAIDVRLSIVPVYSSDGGFTTTNWSQVCKGKLILTF